MRKLLLVLTIAFTFTLSGCIPSLDNGSEGLSEQEIEDIVKEALKDYENEVTTTYDLQSYESAIVDMLNTARSGVLGVATLSSVSSGSGSGVVYKKEGANEYYLVTNEHVVVHEDEQSGIKYAAASIDIVYEKNGLLFTVGNENTELLGYDATTDLAVIKFTSNEDFEVIKFGDSYQIEIGQFVYAIGNPLGFQYYGTVTSGIISGLARYEQFDDFNATLLQHDAAISPGNSGGALLNSNGELIGINNLKLVEDSVSNIGFAIPSNTVMRIVADLEDDGVVTRPFLGISSNPSQNLCGLDSGVCIAVTPGGAAETAGLEEGDVIVGYKNEQSEEFIEILNFNDLKEAILNSSVGDTVIIEYIRDGVTATVVVENLGVHPDDQ